MIWYNKKTKTYHATHVDDEVAFKNRGGVYTACGMYVYHSSFWLPLKERKSFSEYPKSCKNCIAATRTPEEKLHVKEEKHRIKSDLFTSMILEAIT